MSEQATAVNLLNYDRQGLRELLTQMGEKPFRGDQLFQWIHQQGLTDFVDMLNLSKTLRARLEQACCVRVPEIAHEAISTDGTRKWLMQLEDGNCIETVFIPEGGRGTLCVSSQVGCTLTCRFCSTATQGFSRNLTVDEIIGQVWVAQQNLLASGQYSDRPITNVVMMGMGEPLYNFDNVVSAMNIMLDDKAYGLAKRRVTLSTSGVVPALLKLSQVSEVALAISLHAPDDALRDELVPINRKYPLRELLAACRGYFPAASKRSITMEYVMLNEVNDSPQQARALVKLLQGIACKVNLIPFNPYPGAHYVCSSPKRIEAFAAILQNAGFNVIVRRTRGDDIAAACGQLVGQVADKTQRQAKWLARLGKAAIAVSVESAKAS